MNAVFYISAAVAILATLKVITELNAVHVLLYLIVSLLSVALIFYTLGAHFVAALEVIIYAGAIMVLFVFVIMMLNLGTRSVAQESEWLSRKMWAGPVILAAILLAELIFVLVRDHNLVAGVSSVEPKQVGLALFGPYILGVELASMLLLAGLVGAFHLGKHARAASESEEPLRVSSEAQARQLSANLQTRSGAGNAR
jgi:NADH-quinone oxidoreductase subunit J